MLTCIACSRQQFAAGGAPLHEPPEDEDVVDAGGIGGGAGGAATTPSTRHAIKALTAQVGSRLLAAVFVVGSGRLRISVKFFRFLVFWSEVISLFKCSRTLFVNLEHGNWRKVIELGPPSSWDSPFRCRISIEV